MTIKRNNTTRNLTALLAVILLAAFDQLTKYMVSSRMQLGARENGKPKPPQKISFKYLKYTIQDKKAQVERRKGAAYVVSP